MDSLFNKRADVALPPGTTSAEAEWDRKTMERIARICEEIHAFAGTAERTGTKVELRSVASGQRRCTSFRDLVRKYKLYGDGLFYLPMGHWPRGEKQVLLDNVKWLGVTNAAGAQREKRRRTRKRFQG